MAQFCVYFGYFIICCFKFGTGLQKFLGFNPDSFMQFRSCFYFSEGRKLCSPQAFSPNNVCKELNQENGH